MPWLFIACACSALPRIASRPPCTLGCSVLTRPSIISGKPVRSETSRTARPAAVSAARGARGDDLDTAGGQRLREFDQAALVGHRDQGARNLACVGHGPSPSGNL